MVFEYIAFDASGAKTKSTINADSAKEARRLLRERGLQISAINQVKEKSTSSLFAVSLTPADMVSFTRQLSSLIGASVPIDESLNTIKQDTSNKRLNKIVSLVHSGVISGMPLHQAMSETNAFDEYVIASIQSGEKGSNLTTVLERLSTEVEKQYEFKKKISAATTYPIIISVVSLLIIFALLTYVVPQITEVFTQLEQELPPITLTVISISEFLQEYTFSLIIGIIACIILINILFRSPTIKEGWQRIVVKIPVLGRLTLLTNSTRFARTLSILHASNTPMIEALTYSANVVKFLPMKSAITKATTKVKEGSSIYGALKQYHSLPQMMLYMIASGEKSSQLSSMLDKAADSGEYEVDNTIKKILSSFEPLMMLFMGGIVLVIVLSILLPILQINDAIS